ncbi:MAG: hypothetical protein IJH47_06755 [Oscillospiraceae bacterium]|nr:hypothetical protein [Oscillospiraceae bacterium]
MKDFKPDFSLLGDESYAMILGTLRTSCVMLLCSLALLIHTGGLSPRTYGLYRLAAELQSASGAFLLCGNFSALLLERFHRG